MLGRRGDRTDALFIFRLDSAGTEAGPGGTSAGTELISGVLWLVDLTVCVYLLAWANGIFPSEEILCLAAPFRLCLPLCCAYCCFLADSVRPLDMTLRRMRVMCVNST